MKKAVRLARHTLQLENESMQGLEVTLILGQGILTVSLIRSIIMIQIRKTIKCVDLIRISFKI